MYHNEELPRGSVPLFFYQLAEGARRQSNVIFALIYRDLKNRSGDDYGYLALLGIILEPAAGVAVIAMIWYLVKLQEVEGVHVLLFLTVSMTAYAVVRRSLVSIPRTVRTARNFYTFPSVKPFDAIMARFVLELLLVLSGGCLLLAVMWWFMGLHIRTDHIAETILVLLMLLVCGLGFSLFLGIYANRYPLVASVVSLSTRLMLIISAVMHPASELPKEAQKFISWNPIAHAMELLRFYSLGIRPFHGASFEYFAMFCYTCLFTGLVAYYANRKSIVER